MSSGEVRRVSRQDIQLVQNLIERCLQLYMNQKEVVETLLDQAKIEPGFTELVWQKLEEENREFFKAYHLRLMVKHQIIVFNKLLEQQIELMRKIRPAGAASLPISNGSHTFPFQQTPLCYAKEHTINPTGSDNMHHRMRPSSAIINGGPSMHQSLHISDDTSSHSGAMNLSPNMLLAQNTSFNMLQGMNGMPIKLEPSYSSPVFTFGGNGNGNVLDSRPTVGEASVTSFSSAESSSQPLTESPLEAEIGFLSHFPRNFSLSDLTAGFSQSSDILENYYRPPFLGTDADDFPDSPGNECTGEHRRLDTISEEL